MGNITCKWCGEQFLRWSLTKINPVTQKPHLVNRDGNIHTCARINKLPEASPEQAAMVKKIMQERQEKLEQQRQQYQYRKGGFNLPEYKMPQNLEQEMRRQQEEERRKKQEEEQKKHQEEQRKKEEEKKKKEEEEKKEREKPWNGKHYMHEELKIRLQAGLNVLLVGPAGAGKTHSPYLISEELGWTFYPQSVGPQTSKSDLIGYTNGNTGAYVYTALRMAYESGGLFLLDEIDAGNPGVLTILNAMLSNEVVVFPDKTVKKHPMFRCVAAANTYGSGATRTYVGRQPLDGATTDRFTGLDWGYDEKMEAHLGASQPEWVLFVWQLRKAALKLDIKRIFGTRRIMQGCKLLDIGIPLESVKNETVFFGVTPDERKRLEANLG